MNNNDFDDLNQFVKENYNNNKLKKIKRKKIIIILINVVSISCLLAGGIGLKSIYDYKKDLEENKLLQQKLDEYFVKIEKERKLKEEQEQEQEEQILTSVIDFDPLILTNSDTIGWLTVKNTEVNLPIVQSSDNEYYLNHNFEKNWNSLGWAFADHRNIFPELSQNTVLYGHTYKDTLIFSSLTNTLRDDWLNNSENHIIEFSTIDGYHQWQIFSIYTIEETNDYITTDFNNEEFLNFINLVKSRSIKDFNVEVNEFDKVLTLSTCYIDSYHRLVIHAKLVN